MRRFRKIALIRRGTTKIRPSGTYLAYRPKYELYNIRWEFNPYDNDFNPRWSVPHGDDIYPKYHSLKLNIDDGRIYTAKGYAYVGKLSKGDWNTLLNDPRFKKIRDEAIKYRNGCLKQVQQDKRSFVVELDCYMVK